MSSMYDRAVAHQEKMALKRAQSTRVVSKEEHAREVKKQEAAEAREVERQAARERVAAKRQLELEVKEQEMADAADAYEKAREEKEMLEDERKAKEVADRDASRAEHVAWASEQKRLKELEEENQKRDSRRETEGGWEDDAEDFPDGPQLSKKEYADMIKQNQAAEARQAEREEVIAQRAEKKRLEKEKAEAEAASYAESYENARLEKEMLDEEARAKFLADRDSQREEHLEYAAEQKRLKVIEEELQLAQIARESAGTWEDPDV